MKEIPLTQGKIALVDDEDFEGLNKFKWCASKSNNIFYAQRGVRNKGKFKSFLMHREIVNISDGELVDHRNGNGLDNQKINLRLATHKQNMQNQDHSHKDNQYGIKGVYWRESRRKFVARIKANGKVKQCGSFNVLGDADSAYRKAEVKYFGEFSRESNKTLSGT